MLLPANLGESNEAVSSATNTTIIHQGLILVLGLEEITLRRYIFCLSIGIYKQILIRIVTLLQ